MKRERKRENYKKNYAPKELKNTIFFKKFYFYPQKIKTQKIDRPIRNVFFNLVDWIRYNKIRYKG